PRRHRRRWHDRRPGLDSRASRRQRAPRGHRGRRPRARTAGPRGEPLRRARPRRRCTSVGVGARRARDRRPQPPPRRGRRRSQQARAATGVARAALPRDHDQTGERSMTAFALPTPRLVSADILKLRKNLGLTAVTGVLTFGAVFVTIAIMELLHLTDSAKHGPAGGVANLGHIAFLISALGTAAAATVASRAGSGDRDAGIYRDLVVTGRSRRQ